MSFWTGTHWEPDDPPPASPSRPSRSRHVVEAITEGALIAVIVGAAAFAFAPVSRQASTIAGTGTAAAASSTVWVVELAATRSTATLGYGDRFTVGYTSRDRQPWAEAVCYPNDTTVLSGVPNADGSIWGEWYSVYPGGPSPQNFVLGDSVSPVWTGGGADCVVNLVKVSGKYLGAAGFSNETVLARVSFTVTQ